MDWTDKIKKNVDDVASDRYNNAIAMLIRKNAENASNQSRIFNTMMELAKEYGDDTLLEMLEEAMIPIRESNKIMLKVIEYARKRGDHV